MATYYVNKTGSDSNDGSVAVDQGSGVGPWLTLGKAVDTIVSSQGAGGDVVIVGDGTYIETAGGGSYWYITEDFTNSLVIRAENPGQVTVKGSTSSSNSVFFDAATNIEFDGITFTHSSSGNSTDILTFFKNCSGIKFMNCSIDDTSRTGSDRNCVKFFSNALTAHAAGIMFYNTTIKHSSSGTSTTGIPSAFAVQINSDTDGSQGVLDGLYFIDSEITVSGDHAGFFKGLDSCCGLVAENCEFTQTSSNAGTVAFSLGIDGGNPTASPSDGVMMASAGGVIKDCTFTTTTTSHSVLLGAGAYGTIFAGNTISAPNSDYALVLKANWGCTVSGNIIKGALTGVICRGVVSSLILNNVIYDCQTGIHLDDLPGSLTKIYGGLGQMHNNIFYPVNDSGDTVALCIDSSQIANWNIDYNCYWGDASGTSYPLNADGSNKTWSQAQSWWDSYGTELGRTSNDNHSINQDPKFTSMAKDELSLLAASPALRAGLPDSFGEPSSMGVCNPRSPAAVRSRTVNHGRASIIR